jgi:hypothetical protein
VYPVIKKKSISIVLDSPQAWELAVEHIASCPRQCMSRPSHSFSTLAEPGCKELPNRDHNMCRKERFIGSTDCQADPQVRGAAAQADWVVGFIGGTIHQRGENNWVVGPWLSVITRWNSSVCTASWKTGCFLLFCRKGDFASSYGPGDLVWCQGPNIPAFCW